MKIILDVKLYNIEEVSDLLGVSRQSVSRYIRDGKLKAQTVGGQKYVSENNLKEFLQD